MTKRTLIATVIALGMAAPAFAAGPGGPKGINARQARQATRIKNGVKDQELTKGELDKLRGDEAAIRAEERVFRKSGEGLSPAERRDLEKSLDKTSREIARLKHNGRVPGGK